MQPAFESSKLTVSVKSGHQISLKRWHQRGGALGAPVLLLHDIASSGAIFTAVGLNPQKYIANGFAGYLVSLGYDVYIADLRGRGDSWPALTKHMQFGAHEQINEDIPALIRAIVKIRGYARQTWVSHGWGGVLMAAYYARYGNELASVDAMIHFNVARRWQATGNPLAWLHNRKLVDTLIAAKGIVPAKKWGIAQACESAQVYRDYCHWGESEDWIDPVDEFSYSAAMSSSRWPRSLYLACGQSGETLSGVRQFMQELGQHDGRLLSLSKARGNIKDYSHDGLLCDLAATDDHFPVIAEWLQSV